MVKKKSLLAGTMLKIDKNTLQSFWNLQYFSIKIKLSIAKISEPSLSVVFKQLFLSFKVDRPFIIRFRAGYFEQA